MPNTTSSFSRRRFLKTAAQAGAMLTAPQFIPATVLGKNGAVAASERITLGGIGINARGTLDLNCFLVHQDARFLAVCDVRSDRREAVKTLVDAKYGNMDCATYRDLRELLARSDINAVLIATGDRWHTLASILAAKAGKQVYCEKPCSITIAQCQALAETMRRYGCIFQVGTQRRNVGNFRFAVDLAHSGKLGKLHTVHAAIPDLAVRHDWLPAQPEPPKEVVDWDLWLGPAPWRPYNSAYVGGAWAEWRFHFDFDSGARLHDWGAHTVDLCQWANRADDVVPVEYEPIGNRIHARYANDVRLVLRTPYDGWLGVGGCPVRFEGDQGWVETGDSGKVELSSALLRAEHSRKLDLYAASARTVQSLIEGPGVSPVYHVRNFLDCVKSRAQPTTNADIARHSHIACHAAAIAWQLGRKVAFDPVKEEFVGDDEANRMRSRAMREPWHV